MHLGIGSFAPRNCSQNSAEPAHSTVHIPLAGPSPSKSPESALMHVRPSPHSASVAQARPNRVGGGSTSGPPVPPPPNAKPPLPPFGTRPPAASLLASVASSGSEQSPS